MAEGYKVDRVHVERVFPLGQYSSFRVRLEAQVLEGAKTGDVVRALDAEITDIWTGKDLEEVSNG